MLQITDIKIAQKNCPEPFLQPQATNNSRDNASAASFFNILKGQLDVTAQTATGLTPKNDTLQNSARSETVEKEQASRDAARPKGRSEETARAETAEAEQSQKDAARTNNHQEAKANEATKPAAEKKPADDVQQKKAVDNGDPAARSAQKLKPKKADDANTRELFDGLHRMMDVIKGRDQSDLRAVRSGNRDAEDLMNGARSRNGQVALKQMADRLAAAVARLDGRKIPADQADTIARMVAGMKDLLQKSRHGLDRGRGTTAPSATDQNITAVKDLLARVESLLEAPKGEGTQNRQGGDSRGSGDLFGLNTMKSDLQARKADTASGPRKHTAFMDQVGQIIDNAKVVVRDSRNGSFSVRLYPRELGSMNVSLGLENGIVHGKFLVESREAKDLLMGSLEQIKQDLQDAGIAVGEFHVDVDDRRGRMLRDSDSESAVVLAPVDRREEIEAGFELNSKSYHDGHINLVI